MLSTQRSEDKVLQVGFSTTAASLSDSNIYNNFVRVVPSDAVQSKVSVKSNVVPSDAVQNEVCLNF